MIVIADYIDTRFNVYYSVDLLMIYLYEMIT